MAATTEMLTQAEFDQHLARKTLRLGFIGMSNVGKSYCAHVLERDAGFVAHHVDEQIQKEFAFSTMEELAQWLGYPDSPTYKAREAQYLSLETLHTKVDFLDTNGENLVFDATGSVVYLESSILTWLKNNCLLIHIDAGEGALGSMMERFFEHPKPVIWGNVYVPRDGELQRDTLVRCYKTLLRERLEKYRTLAHVSIPADVLFNTDGAHALEVIRSSLPS